MYDLNYSFRRLLMKIQAMPIGRYPLTDEPYGYIEVTKHHIYHYRTPESFSYLVTYPLFPSGNLYKRNITITKWENALNAVYREYIKNKDYGIYNDIYSKFMNVN